VNLTSIVKIVGLGETNESCNADTRFYVRLSIDGTRGGRTVSIGPTEDRAVLRILRETSTSATVLEVTLSQKSCDHSSISTDIPYLLKTP